MYPIKLGIGHAKAQIESLIATNHHPEALIATVFTIEKTLRRVVTQLIISAGHTSKHSIKIVKDIKGMDGIKDYWEIYDPNNRKLHYFISHQDWMLIKDCATMRNNLVHGGRVYATEICKEKSRLLLEKLSFIIARFDEIYGYNGWTTQKYRKVHALHKDPKVKT